jgi:hypothetical protein
MQVPSVRAEWWAQGTVPAPHGPISVRWRRSTRSFVLTVQTPGRTSGTVTIPLLDRGGAIARNGKIVWTHGRAASHIRVRRVGNTVVFAHAIGSATYASVR